MANAFFSYRTWGFLLRVGAQTGPLPVSIQALPPIDRCLSWWMVLLTLLLPVTTSAQTNSRPAGTLRMVRMLDQLAREVTPQENPFLSAQAADLLRQELLTNSIPAEKLRIQFTLGARMLQINDNAGALRAFDEVERLSKFQGIPLSDANALNLGIYRAMAHLREAELRNCLDRHNSDSCLLPIQGHGIHRWQEGSRAALGVLHSLLERFPQDLTARWLLNVASMTVGDYPQQVPAQWLIPPSVFASEYDIGRFAEIGDITGLAQPQQLSGGSLIEDLDGDGFLDIVVTSIGFRDPIRFFHNNGDGTFTDRSKQAGLEGLFGGLNLIATDYNNDGLVDLHILRGGWAKDGGRFPDSLLKNLGNGTFEDVTEAAGLLSFHPGQTAAWFDFDGDGWLDVFVGNETSTGSSRHPCELFRNNRDGTFTEIALAAKLRVLAYVKGVTAGDYNNDGRPDLYVSILGKPNQLFRNEGPDPTNPKGWRFKEVGAAAGVQEPLYSFPTGFFDFDNDGHEDLFVAGYRIQDVGDVAADVLGLPNQAAHAKLYRNRGDGTFEDVTKAYHLDHVLHGMGFNYGDLDNDGWLDFYLGTGDPELSTLIPNRMFRNAGGKTFQDVTTSGGFGHLQKGHAVAFADLDEDGDQDVFANMGGAYPGDLASDALFANPGHGKNWLKLRLVGTRANRPGIGARIQITLQGPSGERVLHRTVGTGGSFGSNPLRLEVGLGDAREIRKLRILWPGSGTVQVLEHLEPNTSYRVTEENPKAERIPIRSFAFPLPRETRHVLPSTQIKDSK